MSVVTRYQFDPLRLDEPRRPGISALMRIRNGADFLRLVIESHLPFYDEIIACYNDCSDDTESILNELAAKHPRRVRPLRYAPRVHPPRSDGHNRAATDSVHSLANYYNHALSRARYSVAVKLDDDHLALPAALAAAVGEVRADLARGVRKLYTFSGLNLARPGPDAVAVYANQPLVGTGDIMYFPVCRQIHWHQARDYEQLGFSGLRLQKQYLGLLYFHLKHLKPCHGFGNLEAEERRRTHAEFLRTLRTVEFAEFCSEAYQRQLRRGHNRFEYWLRSNRFTQGLIYAISQRHAPLRIRRLQRLPAELAGIDWDRDLLAPLGLAPAAGRPGAEAPSRRQAGERPWRARVLLRAVRR